MKLGDVDTLILSIHCDEGAFDELVKYYGSEFAHSFAEGTPFLHDNDPKFHISLFRNAKFGNNFSIIADLNHQFTKLKLWEHLLEADRAFLEIRSDSRRYVFPLRYDKDDVRSIVAISRICRM